MKNSNNENISNSVNVVEVNYQDVQEELKNLFNEAAQKTLEDASGLGKHYAWNKFKSAIKKGMNDLSSKEEKSVYITDLPVVDKLKLTEKQVKKIIKDPANPEFHLDQEDIDKIQSDKFDGEEFVANVVDLADPNTESNNMDSFEGKILKLIETAWEGIAPNLDSAFSSLVNVAKEGLTSLVISITPDSIDDKVEDVIDSVAEKIEELGTNFLNDEDSGEKVSDIAEKVIGAVTGLVNNLPNNNEDEDASYVLGKIDDDTNDGVPA